MLELPRVRVSEAERSSGQLNPASLAVACSGLQHAGAVLLEDAIDPEPLRRLAQRMAADLPAFMGASEQCYGNAPHNFVWGNVQQDPPLELAAHANHEVLANPWALQVISAVMPVNGSRGVGLAFTGNTNLPGSRTQPVHRDASHAAEPFIAFVINIALCDVDEHNGSLECWLGTHLESDVATAERQSGQKWIGNIPPRQLESRRLAHPPPVRVNCRLGSVLVRDHKLWHRGTNNSSNEPRFMVAAVVRSVGSDVEPHAFSRGAERAVARAQCTLASLWPAAPGGTGGWSATFVPENDLPPTARGDGCFDWDRRYLFPFAKPEAPKPGEGAILPLSCARGATGKLTGGDGEQSCWSVPVPTP
eukprot:COSAG03_NODE_2076_length_3153_cov_2.302554_2_plen_362_part_00